MVFETRKQSMARMDINKKIRTFDGRKKWRLEVWVHYELWVKERNSPDMKYLAGGLVSCTWEHVVPRFLPSRARSLLARHRVSVISQVALRWSRGINERAAQSSRTKGPTPAKQTNKQTNKQKQISTSVSSIPFIAIFIAQEKLDGRRFNSLSTHSALWADSPVFECGFCCCCCCCCCCCFVWNSIVFSTFACFWGIEKKTSFDRTIFHV